MIAYWDVKTGQWVNLDSTVNSETGTVTAKVSHFTAFTILAYTRPAAFATSDLAISPVEIDIGEDVTISVLVTNTGDLAGSYEVTFSIDNVAVATEDVTLAGGASQIVTFVTAKEAARTYTVEVNGLSGTFIVKTPPLPPPEEKEEVVPPKEEEKGPEAPVPAKPTNWPLIGGIIAGIVVVLSVILLFIRRRGEA